MKKKAEPIVRTKFPFSKAPSQDLHCQFPHRQEDRSKSGRVPPAKTDEQNEERLFSEPSVLGIPTWRVGGEKRRWIMATESPRGGLGHVDKIEMSFAKWICWLPML